jgi:RecA/RadA recombinase
MLGEIAMGKPYDFSKLRKSVTKSIGISAGFSDPKTWVSTGSYVLNYLISGSFFKGIPLGKVSVLAGESGASKSYIASGTTVKNAQDQGIFVILIDTENALDEPWLQALGVDTSEDKLLKLSMGMVDEVAGTLSEFIKGYKETPVEDRPKVLIVIDSLGMLMTPTEIAQFEAGELKGDFGRKPKALMALVKNIVMNIAGEEVGVLATQHTYASQDPYNPDDIVSGGSGFVYASSILVAMKKLKLKEDEEGNKTKTVNGIRAGVKIMKTRYNKPFETAEIRIPYETGMSPETGLFDLFEAKGLLERDGNSYIYKFLDGSEVKMFRKRYEKNEDNVLHRMMEDHMEYRKRNPKGQKSMEENLELSEESQATLAEIDTE